MSDFKAEMQHIVCLLGLRSPSQTPPGELTGEGREGEGRGEER